MKPIFDQFDCYVAHYKGNTDRKKFMVNQLSVEGIDVTWIENHDREEVRYMDVHESFDMSILGFQKRGYERFSPMLYPLSPSEISLCLKHKESMKLFLNGGKQFMFMMEDDAILCHSFKDNLNERLQSIPHDWDIAYIGHSGGARVEKQYLVDGVFWYKRSFPKGKGTDSFIMTRAAVQKLYHSMTQHKIAYPIDHELTFLSEVFDLNVYWLETPIVAQGSQTGYFLSFQNHSHYKDESVQLRTDMKELLHG